MGWCLALQPMFEFKHEFGFNLTRFNKCITFIIQLVLFINQQEEYVMSKQDAVRKMTRGQLVDVMQAVMHAIPDLSFEQAELLCGNKSRVKRGIKKKIFEILEELETEDRKHYLVLLGKPPK